LLAGTVLVRDYGVFDYRGMAFRQANLRTLSCVDACPYGGQFALFQARLDPSWTKVLRRSHRVKRLFQCVLVLRLLFSVGAFFG
jgi:hypothetical protein